MNAVSLLPVIRFTAVYICTIVDGHGDGLVILLIDLHALLIFPGGRRGAQTHLRLNRDVRSGASFKN